MFNLKTAIIGAAAGFTVSFIAGIIGRVDFLIVLLRAVLSAVFSGVLISAVRFLYVRFLAEAQTEPSAASGFKASAAGSVVDISLDDTELPDTDTAPDFIVENDARVLYKTADGEAHDDHEKKAVEDGFVPSPLGKPLDTETRAEHSDESFSDEDTEKEIEDVEDAEILKTDETVESAESSEQGNTQTDEHTLSEENAGFTDISSDSAEEAGDTVLDTLPDLDGFTPQEYYADTDDEQAVSLSAQSSTGGLRAGQNEINVDLSDSKNIAAAIRTALQKES
ncbi:hypothetical protein H0R92_01110 [Treponema sp. OMZ 840]|uniref:hypothetical protein n=1 Tax=Treponema sp. OMZ 840 TaxID=244313 RepID=UPI003D8DF10F